MGFVQGTLRTGMLAALWVLGTVSLVHAEHLDVSPCASYDTIGAREGLKIIPRNTKAPDHPEEYVHGGTLIRGKHDLSQLPEGDYVYLIDEVGNLMVSPTTPNLRALPSVPDKYLVSHRTMIRTLQQLRGIKSEAHQIPGQDIPPWTIISGEIHVTKNHLVRQLNDKGNTFHSDGANLNYGARVLRDHGLPIEDKTEIVSFAGNPKAILGRHQEMVEVGMMRYDIARHPPILQATKDIQEAIWQLAQLFPTSPPINGTVDVHPIVRWALKNLGSAAMDKLGSIQALELMVNETSVWKEVWKSAAVNGKFTGDPTGPQKMARDLLEIAAAIRKAQAQAGH